MKAYAQIDAAGLCVGVSELAGAVKAPHLIAIDAAGPQFLGKKWDGAAWVDAPAEVPTDAQKAASDLAAVDAATGMSRTMRETLIAIAGKVGADVAFLAAQEAKAAAARGKLGK